MINREKVINAFENIKVSEQLDRRILNSTVNKKEKKLVNLSYMCIKRMIMFVLVLFISAFTFVSAKDFVSKCILNKVKIDNNSYKQIVSILDPVDIIQNRNVSCNNIETLSDLETSLGIKFIFDTSKYNGKIAKCDIKTNDNGEIEKVIIKVSEFYDYSFDNQKIDSEYNENFTFDDYMLWQSKRKMVDLYISFMTSAASEKTKEEFKNIEVLSGTGESLVGLKETEFYAKNINTSGYYFMIPSKNVPLSKIVLFENNNILYLFSGNKLVTIEELLEIINEF